MTQRVKKLIKRYRHWLIAILCFALFVSLHNFFVNDKMSEDVYASNPYYTIIRRNGTYYLHTNLLDYKSLGYLPKEEPLLFESVAHMKSAITSGNLSLGQLRTLTSSPTVKTCMDFDNLLDVALPEDVQLYGVEFTAPQEIPTPNSPLYGNHDHAILGPSWIEYILYLTYPGSADKDPNERSAFIAVQREKIAESYLSDTAKYKAVAYAQGEGYYVQNGDGAFFYYTLQDEGKILHIREYYTDCADFSSWSPELIPDNIQFCGNVLDSDGNPDAHNYFFGYLPDFEVRPTPEWLLSLGLVPYVEAEA